MASYTYTYGDSSWKDKLTSYNGNTITYDEIGNPLSYYNGLEFDWQNGRQLASVSGSDLAISYKYNSNGIRTQKTVNGVTTDYTLEGSNVVKETNGTDTLWYYYDATGSVISFELNGTAYFYAKNLQGDIVAIVDSSGNKVVEYVYDSWGKLTSITGTLADTVGVKNPYRYRGYRYDTELGMYYLQSRYYDPAVKRFINADGFVSTGQGILGNNMFAYCRNNPINCIDSSGFWTISISLGGGAVFGIGGCINIGFAFDGKGNFDWQYSYSALGKNDTVMVGIIGANIGLSVQYTNADTVYNLYGPATYIGASGGPWWYIGGDIVSFNDASDLNNMTVCGGQLVAGVGVGIDVHIIESYTLPLTKSKNISTYATSSNFKKKFSCVAIDLNYEGGYI